jgi:hypothetical protein
VLIEPPREPFGYKLLQPPEVVIVNAAFSEVGAGVVEVLGARAPVSASLMLRISAVIKPDLLQLIADSHILDPQSASVSPVSSRPRRRSSTTMAMPLPAIRAIPARARAFGNAPQTITPATTPHSAKL